MSVNGLLGTESLQVTPTIDVFGLGIKNHLPIAT